MIRRLVVALRFYTRSRAQIDPGFWSDTGADAASQNAVQMAIGVSSQWFIGGRCIRLALMRVWRTREFTAQSGRHGFGSVALSVEL